MQTQVIKLEKLFLDPNNYRLRSHPNYLSVDEANLTKPAIQSRTYNMISGTGNIKIYDIIESLKANGFLKVDNIKFVF